MDSLTTCRPDRLWPRPHRRAFAGLLLAACVLLLPACQSGADVENALDPQAGAKAKTQGKHAPRQSWGKGGTKVTMVLPISAPGEEGKKGQAMRDAAELAMADLGNNLLTLTIEDSGGQAGRAKDLVVAAMSSGAKVVIGPTERAAVQKLSTISVTRKPLVLALADGGSRAGVYSVLSSEGDSAAAGAGALAAKGKRKFVLLVAEGATASEIEKRVANALSAHGASLLVAVPYGPVSGAPEMAVANLAEVVDSAEGIIVASGDDDPLPLLAALKGQRVLSRKVELIGTNRWLERPLTNPLFQDAYLAAPDMRETGPIAARFKARFNYDLSTHAAYAYDSVALAAGIASALGPDGFQKKILENPMGFRGSTGIFRFRQDGASERLMPLYRIQNGSLKLVSEPTTGF